MPENVRHERRSDPGATRAVAVKSASHLFSGVVPRRGRVHTPANLAWMPVADGQIVPADGAPLAPVPLLLGYTRNEARYFIKPGMLPYNRLLLWALTRALAGSQARSVRSELAEGGPPLYERFDRAYTSAVFAEPLLATAERLRSAGRVFHCYRFGRVSPGAARSAELARHTAELRYLFGTLTADGYDETDRQVSRWMQDRWLAFARDGAPADRTDWPACGDDGHVTVIDGVPAHGRIDDEPVVPLLHAART